MQFEEIYVKYFNEVYRFLVKLSGDKYIAEEITSETFFKAIMSIDSFRGECEISVWLCQIAKNLYFSYRKKNKPTESITDEQIETIPDTSPSVSDVIADKDIALQIKAALHDISDPYKEVFMWRVYAEISFEQIGKLYGKTANWACVTYHRAKEMIKNKMEIEK